MHWAEGEERRWRFGFGVSWSGVDGRDKGKGKGMELEEGEEEEVGGVGKDFRWRRWQGLERELRREMEVLEGRAEGDQDGEEEVVEVEGQGAKAAGGGVSAYSVGVSTCCRRISARDGADYRGGGCRLEPNQKADRTKG